MLDNVILFAQNHMYLVAAFVALIGLFFYFEAQKGGKSLSPQEVSNLINREEAMVIDIRNNEQFRKGHIHGAENVAADDIEGEFARLKALQGKPIILVCELGNQASSAGKKLMSEGIAPVYRLKGGVDSWRMENLPLIKG